MRVRIIVIAVLAGAAIATAGCGGSSSSTTGSETTTNASGATLTIVEKDFSLDPSSPTVKAGSVTIEAKNEGGTSHALEIEGNGLEEQRTDTVGPNDSSFITVDLKPGTYTMYCPVDGHRGLGMKGTITVTG
jgi:plastocyanin